MESLLPQEYHEDTNLEFAADVQAEPIALADMLKASGQYYEPVKAEQLVDTQFDIVSARSFKSSFDHQDHVFYCQIKDLDGNQYATVLGGASVVPILDALSKSGFKNPLRVTLRFVKGGSFSGYYVLE